MNTIKTTMFKRLFISVLFCFIVLSSQAELFELTKTIPQRVAASGHSTVSINSKYGNINVSTWDEDSIVIVATIIVKGDKEDAVKERFNNTNVKYSNNGSEFVAQTIFDNTSQNGSSWLKMFTISSSNINVQVNYDVKMPFHAALMIDHKYGNVFIDVLAGKANIHLDYGTFNANDLQNENDELHFDYVGSATIASANKLLIDADYSKFTITQAKQITTDMDYGGLHASDADVVTLRGDYSTFNVEKCSSANIHGDYLTIKLGTVSHSAIIESDYANCTLKKLSDGFQELSIQGDYSNFRVGIPHYIEFNQSNSSKDKMSQSIDYHGANQSNINVDLDYGKITFVKD